MRSIRDRLWMFSVEAGTDDREYGVPLSRMTPIESCLTMGVSRLMMITNEQNEPKPPLEPYFRALRPLDEVAWSLVGSGSQTGWAEGREVAILRDLATRYPNLTGVYMDDFFNKSTADGPGTFSLNELDTLRRQLVVGTRRLNLWVVLYTHQIDMPIERQLERIDIINLWTWHAKDLVDLDENLARVEEKYPGARISLGLYLYDYGDRREMPLELMQHQCERALAWLHEGRIESAALLGSYLCDLGLETVEWTRDWIANVGDQQVGSRDMTM